MGLYILKGRPAGCRAYHVYTFQKHTHHCWNLNYWDGMVGLTVETRNLNLLALKLLTKKATTTSKRLKRLTYMPITKKTKWSSNKQRSSNTSLPQKQTISHVLSPCCIGRGIIKSDGVSNLFAQLVVAFLRYTLCYCNSCNSSRLSDANDFTILTKTAIVQKLWKL